MNYLLKKIFAPRRMEYLSLDSNFNIVDASDGIKRFAEFPAEVDLGRDVRLGFPEFFGIEDILLEIKQGKQINFHLKAVARVKEDQQPLYLDISFIAYPDGENMENKLFVFFEDVTEKMLLEQALIQKSNEANLLLSSLSAAKDYIDKIINYMAEALLVTNISGKIKIINQATQDLFGYSEAELIGQSIGNISSELAQNIAKNLELSQPGELFKDLEVDCQTKSGGKVVVSFSCSAIDTDIKDLKDFVYVGRNVTERKRIQEELIRTIEQEKELRKLKSRFVSIASHEFRTPLTMILLSSDILRQYGFTLSEEKKIKQLEKIKSAVINMTRLLDDILVINKSEEVQLKFKPISLDIVNFCQEILEEIDIASKKSHQLIFACAEAEIIAEVDENLLRQILTNLLSNAVKYSPSGSAVCLELRCRDGRAIFQVKDRGIGIPKTDLPHLFEAFHRATNTGNISGTGLGLAIARGAAELHGGTITVESELGAGTTFTVVVPLGQTKEGMG